MGIQVCANQGAGPILAPVRGQNREHFGHLNKNIFLKNYWLECIEIWYETSLSLGQGDSSLHK